MEHSDGREIVPRMQHKDLIGTVTIEIGHANDVVQIDVPLGG